MDPREISHLSIEEKKARFRQATITHRLLEQTHRKIMQVVREPAGFTFVLTYGPTGVGKSKMIETVVRHLNEVLRVPSIPALLRPLPSVPTPVLAIEADPPDGSVFNRGYYYRTALTLMGEPTYQQHLHMDIHGEAQPVKRRPLRGKAAESNDLPELKAATKEAMPRHGVQVVMIDEAHHMLYGGNGMGGSTLQEQLEWLKSLSSATLHILVGTYDLLNFGKLNGQIGRRCLPVHFSRYLLQREADCLEFQSALVSLLEQVPLRCDVETLVGSYWVYFYEGCIGAVGVLKDWLMCAVSAALDEGQDTLTLDCLQDHILPTDILRQMALDASEGEQKLENTESNREHLWRILQGGELIAPIPPLPPRATAPQAPSSMSDNSQEPSPNSSIEQRDTHTPFAEVPEPPVKKTRSRKKIEVQSTATLMEQGSVPQAGAGGESAPAPPKRGRRKKSAEAGAQDGETHSKAPSTVESETTARQIDVEGSLSSPKPKRARHVGEPKPKRYAVGESEEAHHG